MSHVGLRKANCDIGVVPGVRGLPGIAVNGMSIIRVADRSCQKPDPGRRLARCDADDGAGLIGNSKHFWPAPWQCPPRVTQRHPPATTPRPRRLRRAPRGTAAPPERPGARYRAAPCGLDRRRRPRERRLGKAGGERFQTGFQLRGVRHPSAARTSLLSPRAMAWAEATQANVV